ncbi:lipopolysaccharide transport periplasmic protein LptA [Xylophilus rhododendri]|uniref:Lipopolysaccharide export system protein LptA n=1 Tax=Xylophilus rhododendri TaxID=2697032 RepID=A0A857J4F9_9BURK|nr:lipopolysaccharide transport periplasmic protein LptA [Xylophilus rhododendri]QHI98676.1 lipopolysaccharide transport periplasmic protein LptA [Xylophilus rhododendri]
MKTSNAAPLLLLISGLLFGSCAFAEKADRTKPMNVEADALRHDDLAQTSVFTGNVVLTKGTIIIRGTRLEVRQDPDGYQFGVVTADPGKRAYFKQKRDTQPGAPDEFIEGEGEVIDYDGKADRVRFTRRAEMHRLQASTVMDEVHGNVIVYNNVTDVYTVDGSPTSTTPNASGAANASGGSTPGGRIRAVLSPRGAPGESPATSTPPVDPGGPAPALRSTPAIGGSKP